MDRWTRRKFFMTTLAGSALIPERGGPMVHCTIGCLTLAVAPCSGPGQRPHALA